MHGVFVKATSNHPILLQNFLGWLSRPDICNRLSVINLQPGDDIMAATSLAEAVTLGMRKTGTKRIWPI